MVVITVALLANVPLALAASGGPGMPGSSDLLVVGTGRLAAQAAGLEEGGDGAVETPPETAGPPPIPLLTIEGYSGGAITPMAYIANGDYEGPIGMPVGAYTFINMGNKRLHAVSVMVPLFDRFEFSYAYNRFALGSMFNDARKMGLDMIWDHVHLHHFNLRARIIKENSYDLPLPEVTGGVHFKYNEGIRRIDANLGGALKALGYERRHGFDYTLTASKTFPELACGRPLILTGGLRLSRGAQLGYLGFGGDCQLTFEGSVAVLPTDYLMLAYEFRGKNNPYRELDGLVGEEDSWHVLSATWIVTDQFTVSGLWGYLGNIAETRADCALGVQMKYEF